jgi:exopolysaccharide production protein ExoQ
MNPSIALFFCVIFIVGLLIIDRRQTDDISLAIWIPLIWFMLLAAKPLGGWFNVNAFSIEEDYISGSSIDRNVLLTLFFVGLMVLCARRKYWKNISDIKIYIGLFVLYCGISVLWSDYPDIAFRRYLRGLGTLLMIFIVMMEKNPLEAINLIIRRMGYILIPLSILIIKYYRQWGVVYGYWMGEEMVVGVASHKNSLGQLCVIFGLYCFWNFANLWRNNLLMKNKIQSIVNGLLLIMVAWLLVKANSATSIFALLAGVCIYLSLGLSSVKNNIESLGLYMFLFASIAFILLFPLNLIESIVELLGRNLTLTDRVFLWQDLLDVSSNAVVGSGFESFWLGDRIDAIWAKWKWRPNQAHNGYLEIYLNLGLIGLTIMLIVLINIYRSMRKTLQREFEFGRFQMAYFGSFLLVNITEASMKFRSIAFAVVLLMAMYSPQISKTETTYES